MLRISSTMAPTINRGKVSVCCVRNKSVTSSAGEIEMTDRNMNGFNKERNKLNLTSILELSKFRLSGLVVCTTGAGFLCVTGGASALTTLAAACVGTGLCAASASSFNQIIEVERDRKMKRTRNRPLVTGRISMNDAKKIAVGTGLVGTTTLLVGTNSITAMLGLGNIFLYAGPYTYLKPRSEINTWVGAVVGAIPPIMGATAAGGSLLDLHAMLLASTLYLWQFPHFFALSYMHRVDYARGGFQMVPTNTNDTNGIRTSQLITRYTCYLSTLPFLSTSLGVTSYMFTLEGILLNAYALYVARIFHKERTNSNARKIFLFSLWYLPSWMILFFIHSKSWNEQNVTQEDFDVRNIVSKYMLQMKNIGKEYCWHEQLFDKEDNCFITVGKQATTDLHKVTQGAANIVPATNVTSMSPQK